MNTAAACACGCGGSTRMGRRFLHGHWAKANREVIGAMKRTEGPKGHGDGYLMDRTSTEPLRLQHVIVAERALGKPLPPGVVVHHVDEDRSNNAPSNLVICPDTAYHALIHRRMRAFAACGHADWRKCQICKKYDRPENLSIPKKSGTGSIQHLACLNQQRRAKRME